MSYDITLSNGTKLTTIYDRSIDTTTSLSLIGRGSVQFGSSVTENIVHLLENFANTTAPARPVVGQLWYDSGNDLLKVYSSGNAWEAVSDDGAFGTTLNLQQGALISGNPSGLLRASGTVGVALVGGLGETTVAVTLAEGVVVAATSNYDIPYLSLPATILVAGQQVPFGGLFPKGIAAGITLATQPYNVSFSGPGITQITGGTTGDGGVTEQEIQGLISSINGNTALIQQESLTRANAISALSEQLTTLSASTSNGNTAALTQESQTRADADSALSVRITNLTATVNNNSAAIGNEQVARVSATNSLALQLSTLVSTVGQNTTAITNEATTRANGDSALSQQISNLSTTVNSNTASIQSEATTRANADNSLALNAITISASANRQRVFFQSTAPAGNSDSVWFNSAAGNTPYQWNGTAWVPAQDAGISTNAAAILNESSTRVTNETAITNQLNSLVTAVNNSIASYESSNTAGSTDYTSFTNAIDLLNAQVQQNTSSIQNEASTRATADSTLTTQINNVSASANRQRIYFQSSPPPGATDAVWYNLSDGNKPYYWTGTIWSPAQDAGIATNAAAVTSEATARTNADSALGSRIDALTTSFNGLTANLTNEATTRASADGVLATSRQALAASTSQTRTWFQTTTPTYASMFPVGTNSHPNSLPSSTAGFSTTASDAGSSSCGVNVSTNPITPTGFAQPVGQNTLYLTSVDQRALATGAAIDCVFSLPQNVISAGTSYEFSAYVGVANAYAILILAFVDQSNSTLATFTSSGSTSSGSTVNGGQITTSSGFPGGTALSNYGRLWVYGQAPTGASSAKLYVRLDGTGTANAYLMAQRLYFGQMYAGQTAPADWIKTASDQLWLNASDNNQVYTYNAFTNVWSAAGDQRIAQNMAAITNEATTRLNADNALSSQITALTATVNSNTANITNNAQTAADSVSSLATQVSTVSASASRQRVFFQSTAPTGNTDAVWYNTADGNKPYRWNGSAWVAAQDAAIAALNAAVSTETSARAAADSALASQITALTSTVNQNTSQITSNASTTASQISSLAQQITTVSAAASAQRVYFGTATPPGSADAVWFNANQGNSPYKWNSTTQTWVSAQDAGIGIVAANLSTETTARQNADSALSSQITTLGSTLNTNVATLTASIQSEATTRANADSSLSQQISTLTSTVNSNNATATSAIQTLTTNASALSSQVSSLSTTVNGNTASISTLTSSVNGLSANFAVTGYIDGTSGGFVFQGVKNAGGGATYTTTFNSNVVINGNLLINGSVPSNKLALNQLLAYQNGIGYGSGATYTTYGWGLSMWTFSTSSFDGSTFHVGSGEGGLYLVECVLSYNANVADCYLGIYINGGQVNVYQSPYGGSNTFNVTSVTGFVYANPGDNINIVSSMDTQQGASRSSVQPSRLSIVRLQG